MIRLGRLTDYGIVLMAHLAGAGAGPHAARDIAAETQLPLPAVSKLLKALAREGRGAKGGYQLARPAEQITVPEMIAALEGPIALTDCNLHEGACSQEPRCHVRTPWQRINRAVHDALSRIRLADLAAQGALGRIVPLVSLGVDTTGIDTRPHLTKG
ncbi:MAG: SUF system Fe-S cluster assembly regulator [Deltaproteobacteria bacterium]|nr:MAG: SUF system Fe-S cluster assembly regulator [Deltaproteobacteria bacterium]